MGAAEKPKSSAHGACLAEKWPWHIALCPCVLPEVALEVSDHFVQSQALATDGLRVNADAQDQHRTGADKE